MPDFPETNYSLIARVRNLGDSAAWAEFLKIYQPVVHRMALRRGLQEADTQDVVQQVFMSIANSIEGWESRPNTPPFRAWLITIARNAITKALIRGSKAKGSGTSSVAEMLASYAQPEATASEILVEVRKEIIRWATEQVRPEFSDEIWRLFQLTAIEGFQIAEVAQSTGRSVGSIYIARFRIVTRLREKIQEAEKNWATQE